MPKKSKILRKDNEDRIIINNDCTKCDICVLECPTEAIYEGPLRMEVDDTKCILCKACIEVCPIEQISTQTLIINNLIHMLKKKYIYAEK